MPASCPPPPSLCTDKGPAWITFKAVWQRPWGCLGPELQRLCWAYYPLASCPLGTLGLQLVVLVLLFPHPECLAEAEEAGMAGKAEWCQFPASSPVSATPKRRETW